MPTILDNDVERPLLTARYPVTDLVSTYLEQSGNQTLRLGHTSRLAETRTLEDLWDYLGDFA